MAPSNHQLHSPKRLLHSTTKSVAEFRVFHIQMSLPIVLSSAEVDEYKVLTQVEIWTLDKYCKYDCQQKIGREYEEILRLNFLLPAIEILASLTYLLHITITHLLSKQRTEWPFYRIVNFFCWLLMFRDVLSFVLYFICFALTETGTTMENVLQVLKFVDIFADQCGQTMMFLMAVNRFFAFKARYWHEKLFEKWVGVEVQSVFGTLTLSWFLDAFLDPWRNCAGSTDKVSLSVTIQHLAPKNLLFNGMKLIDIFVCIAYFYVFLISKNMCHPFYFFILCQCIILFFQTIFSMSLLISGVFLENAMISELFMTISLYSDVFADFFSFCILLPMAVNQLINYWNRAL